MRPFQWLFLLGHLFILPGCGSRSAVTSAQDGSVAPRRDQAQPAQVDGTMPRFDLGRGDSPYRRDLRIVDGDWPETCIGPAGEPLQNYIGAYKGTWSGQVDCPNFSFGFDGATTSLIIELSPSLAPGTLQAEGALSLNSGMLQGAIEGYMDCFQLVASITISINAPMLPEKFKGTMEGVFLPTWGLPPHFGEGTWQAESPNHFCKGYGTWRGIW